MLLAPPLGFPAGSDGKESTCNAGDLGLISGWGRSPGEGKGNPLQYSCLENSVDREAWWAIVHGVAELDTTERPTLTIPPTYSSMFPVQVDECKVLGVIRNGGWRRQWHPTLVLLPGKPHRQRSLVGCSPWGRWESDTTERLHFHFHALEKEMASHSSVLAWRIPGTGEPGGLPSMGSHRVRHD